MNSIEKTDVIIFEKLIKEIKLDSSIKNLYNKKCCICNKLFLLFSCYITFSFFIGIWLILILVILLIPFFSMFVNSNFKEEEIFFNNSTYYEVFKKLNNGVDYQSDIDKLRYLNITTFISLTILFIIFIIPYFYNKLKAIYFLLIYLLVITCILVINIFTSIIYNRLRNTFEIYPNELDNIFSSNGTHIIPLDKRNNLGPTGSSSIILCIIYYILTIAMFFPKRYYEKDKKLYENENNNEYNEISNSTN